MKRLLLSILAGIMAVLMQAGCAGSPAASTADPRQTELTSPLRLTAVVETQPQGRDDMMDPIVLKDALTHIDAAEKTYDWKPFRAGVQIARIYNTPNGGPSAAFLKYEPGASVPPHMHGGYEHIFVLQGSQVDRSGEHGVGTVIINPPGSSHSVTSPNGCIVLIIWEKPVILLPETR